MEGPIALRARAQIPATWDALARSTQYGEPQLQMRVDFVKSQLFATIVAQASEAAAYSPLQLEYAGKVTALQVIPAGMDYWSDQYIIETSTGTNESRTYPDRIAALQRIYAQIAADVAALEAQIAVDQGHRITKRKRLGQVSTKGVPFRTPDPNCFPRYFATTELSVPFVWGPVTTP